jgi:zinc protease
MTLTFHSGPSGTTVPALRAPRPLVLPATVDRRLGNGLRVVAVHRPGVPTVEMRLRIPLACPDPERDATKWLLGETLLAGTRHRDRIGLAERLEDLGSTLATSVDADQLIVGGTVLSPYLRDVLAILTEVLLEPAYPQDEVAAERGRLLQRLSVARSKASVRARETLNQHLFGGHPYGRYLPDLDRLAAVTADDVRALHGARLVPRGSVLIMVGDLRPDAAADLVDAATTGWTGGAAMAEPLPPLPPLATDPSLLVHRPGSVQSSIRIGGPAVPRDAPRFAALQLANVIYGGYFSSRLVSNIREDKGYTYTPRSYLDHGAAGSTLVIEADVATTVTAPALLEMWYELGRLSTMRPSEEELDAVRQFVTGTAAMAIATQSGLATTLVQLLGADLDLAWISRHLSRVAAVTADDIYEMGVHLLAPCRLAAVVIGDATEIAEPLQAFGPWEVRR